VFSSSHLHLFLANGVCIRPAYSKVLTVFRATKPGSHV